MRQAVIERLQEVMRDTGLDAIIAASPENYAYVTGFVVPSHPLMRWRHAMAVVTADGRTALLTVDMEETTVRSKADATTDIRVWGEFTDSPMLALADLLADLGLTNAQIGVELDFLPAEDYARLTGGLLPEIKFAAAQRLLDRQRQIKTAEELELLRQLSRIADRAITDAYGAMRAGMTEMDLAGALTSNVYRYGAEDFRLMIVATGERSEYPNVGPTERVLEPGDICRVEIFPKIAGYHAGVCRTAVVGDAPALPREIWQNLVECKYMLLERMKPGASTREIYQAFIAKFSELDLPAIDFVGHGIGVHLHEEPYLGKYDDAQLEAGMVLGIEPLVYGSGMGFGLQNKDMVTITEAGCELLSDYADTDELIRIEA
ncbi:MAG: Xaa-Pro peptidase family protein [Alphaproteobacteria bacterium]|nr:Xaa-Pro peptidase family protein [Alphaproteobacteria bacterium]